MSKKMNLKISGDLKKLVKDKANDILSKGVEYICPKCSKTIAIKNGKNICKYCGAEIDFKGTV